MWQKEMQDGKERRRERTEFSSMKADHRSHLLWVDFERLWQLAAFLSNVVKCGILGCYDSNCHVLLMRTNLICEKKQQKERYRSKREEARDREGKREMLKLIFSLISGTNLNTIVLSYQFFNQISLKSQISKIGWRKRNIKKCAKDLQFCFHFS